MFGDQPPDKIRIAAIALDEGRLGRHRPSKAGDQIVENDDIFAGVEKQPNHVAADIAGSAGDQDTHETRNNPRKLNKSLNVRLP